VVHLLLTDRRFRSLLIRSLEDLALRNEEDSATSPSRPRVNDQEIIRGQPFILHLSGKEWNTRVHRTEVMRRWWYYGIVAV